MSRRQRAVTWLVLGLGLALFGAGCSTTASATPVVQVCSSSVGTAVVDVSIVDFEFQPAAMTARTGQVIGFTNDGFESHNVTLDDGSCKTATLDHGQTAGLLFNVAGAYPVHCTIHPWLTGTITIGA